MQRQAAISRRGFLGAVSAGTAATALVGCGTPPLPLPDPLPPPPMPDDLTLRLLSRITFGPTPQEVATASGMRYEDYLEQQLNDESLGEGAVPGMIAPLRTLRQSPDQLFNQFEFNVALELITATFVRAAYSPRQLYERMVEFWSDHFNIYVGKSPAGFLKTVDDREVIRRHALGNFREMLQASAKSPAMLVYLDNAFNKVGAPNENYARESLELHTVGVNGGYTQHDVEELARVFTGWSVRNSGSNRGTFVFRAADHDEGAKEVLGLFLPAGGGIRDGELALDHMARHPSTARFIARKLVRRFISESEPAEVVDRVANAFSGSDGDIKTTLRALLARESMQQATPKFKRPFHLMVDATRRGGATFRLEGGLEAFALAMGHLPFYWPAPNGYPDVAPYWAPGLLNRWRYAEALGRGVIATTRIDPRAILEVNEATTPEQIVAVWNQMFFAGAMPAAERQALLDYCNAHPNDTDRQQVESFGLAISSPAFQWH